MATGDVTAPAKPSKPMGRGEDNESAKSSKPTVSTQEKTAASSQPDWSTYMQMQMQAYYGAGLTPPPFFTSSVASSAAPYPYIWGNQRPLVQPYATPHQYPVLYHHRGLCAHPNLVAGLALTISEAEGKISYKKDWDSMRKCVGSGHRSGERGKTACSSANDGASQRGSEGSSDQSDDKANQNEFFAMKKRSFDQMFADGAQNNSTAHSCGPNYQISNLGHPLVSKSASNLNVGMSSNACPAGSKSKMLRSHASGVSQAVASAMMVRCEEVMSEQCCIQDESELKKEKKRLRNKESARKSRIRKEQEYEKLLAMAKALRNETSMLAGDLKRHSKNCVTLKDECLSLMVLHLNPTSLSHFVCSCLFMQLLHCTWLYCSREKTILGLITNLHALISPSPLKHTPRHTTLNLNTTNKKKKKEDILESSYAAYYSPDPNVKSLVPC